MRNAFAVGVTVLALGIVGPTFAQQSGDYCPKVPREKMIAEEAVKKNVQNLGYEVRRVRFDDGCYKVYITEKTTGSEVEAYYDPASGELVRAKLGK